MYFWKNKFIPKELQEHIEKTIAKVQGNKLPVVPIEEVKEFIKKSEIILSGSANKKQEDK